MNSAPLLSEQIWLIQSIHKSHIIVKLDAISDHINQGYYKGYVKLYITSTIRWRK